MGAGSIFGRDDDTPAPDPAEGVRLIGADEAAEAAERGDTARRRGRDEKRYGDRPEPPPPDVKPAIRFPLADSEDPSQLERPRPAPVSPRTADSGSTPVISVGPPTGESQLPHWTEPATGEVPRVLIGEDGEIDGDDDRWQAFASSSPRWRDQETDWNREEDTIADLVHDDETRVGALDERDRMSDEEFLTFDDLEVPAAGAPTAPPRGTAADPIKIRATGGPRPAAPGRVAPPRAARAGAPGGPVEPAAGGGGGGRDRQQAIQVGLVIAGVAVAIFAIGSRVQWAMLVVIVPVLVAATAELFTASRRAGFKPVHLAGLVAAAALPFAAYGGGETGVMLVLFLTFALVSGLFLLREAPGRPVANLALTIGGVVYVGVLGSYAALLLRSGPWANQVPAAEPAVQGNGYLFVVAVGIVLHDVAGYLLGSRIGKTPLSKASPNKTREGLAVGMGATVLAVVVLGGLFGIGLQNVGQAFVLGLVVAVMAPIGDLVESMIKRDLGIKDMGDVLPSHGGVLDRFDGFLFALPAAYYTLRVLGLIA